MTNNVEMSRRGILRGGAGLAGLSLMAGGATLSALQAFGSRPARAADLNYGPLSPVIDETTGLPLLQLPQGFQYMSYGWRGDMMRDGIPTPGAHDGMAVVRATGSNLTLVRNHEQGGGGAAYARSQLTYNPQVDGGTTNLTFNTKAGKFTSSWASLSGTIANCCGGPTPWGSWLTCEETTLGVPDLGLTSDHGFIFEVPASGNTDPTPIKAMGRFAHEAVAVDPQTGFVYETEDRTPSGFYRYSPAQWGNVRAGGQLHMLKIKNATAVTDLRGATASSGGKQAGETYDVEWVLIDNPEQVHAPGTTNGGGVVTQGMNQFGAVYTRLEGCWYDSGSVYFTSTSGGPAGRGQIWQYTPAEEKLKLIFVSPGGSSLNSPDNITVHANRGIILCEDGSANPERMHFLTFDGVLTTFAANNIDLRQNTYKNIPKQDYRGSEWAGACFSPDGEWLFVNIQTPGVTFAITGPWRDYAASAS